MAKDQVKIQVAIDGGKAQAEVTSLKEGLLNLGVGDKLAAGFSGFTNVLSQAGISLGPLQAGLDKMGAASGALSGAVAAGPAAAGLALAGVGVAAGIAGKQLFDLGSEFQGAFENIRVGTGATGEALAGLEEDFKAVAQIVPADMGTVSTAIADLNTRLGLTGQPLQDLSEQLINLSMMTGGDLAASIETASGMFTAWGVSAEEMTGTMDYLFKVSQSTGIPIDQLSSTLEGSKAALSGFGFSLKESAALLGNLDKAGLDSNMVVAQLQRSMGRLAQSGQDPKTALAELVTQIQSTDDATQKLALATDVFGSRGGPQMVQAIESGALSLDELVASLEANSDTINGLDAKFETVGEKFAVIGNRLKVAFEPLATAVFTAVADGLTWIMDATPGVIAAFEPVGTFFGALWGGISSGFEQAMVIMAPAFQALQDSFAELASHFEGGGDLLAGFGQTIMEFAPVVGEFLGGAIGVIVGAVAALLGNVLIPLASWLIENVPIFFGQVFETGKSIVTGVIDAISGAINAVWNSVLQPFGLFITGTLWPGIQSAFNTGASVVNAVMTTIRTGVDGLKIGFEYLKSGVVGAWEAIKSALSSAGQWINRTFLDPIRNGVNSVIETVNMVPGVNLPTIGGGGARSSSGGGGDSGVLGPVGKSALPTGSVPPSLGKSMLAVSPVVGKSARVTPRVNPVSPSGTPISVSFNVDAIDGPSVDRFFAEHRGKLLAEVETAVARGQGRR